ncbi:MAG: hypothetical protein K2O12_04075, partial [Muribaculaceae bacterium]|nr:hypothetical protein [Muribaculaceae bacterium]
MSPYLLFLFIAGITIWYCTSNAETHFVPETPARGLISYNEVFTHILPGDTEPTQYPAGHTFEVLGKFGNQCLLEDSATGTRFATIAPKKDTYTTAGNPDILNRHINSSFCTYVKTDDVKDIFIGRNIKDVVAEIGDYTEANPASGYYFFKYLVPITGRIRHESGTVFRTDASGKIIASDELSAEETSSNLFGYLPFYSSIVSWNILNHGVDNLISIAEPEVEKGFFAMILGWIWGFIWSLVKLAIMLVIIALIFILPATAILAVTGPMVRIKTISTTTINYINFIFAAPIEYILFISFTDYFHESWWVAGPIFFLFTLCAFGAINAMTVNRRCVKCGAVDSMESESTILDVRTKVRIENETYEDRKLKYKGFSLK